MMKRRIIAAVAAAPAGRRRRGRALLLRARAPTSAPWPVIETVKVLVVTGPIAEGTTGRSS